MSSPICMDIMVKCQSDAELIKMELSNRLSIHKGSFWFDAATCELSCTCYDYRDDEFFEILSKRYPDTLFSVEMHDDDYGCEKLYAYCGMSYTVEGEIVYEFPEFDKTYLYCQSLDPKNLTIEEFKCDSDLSKYVDSMLFDSGTVLGSMRLTDEDGNPMEISLEVRGEVAVDYIDGITYHEPSGFPEELRERIRRNPNRWDICAPSGEGNDEVPGIFVGLNNWFEVTYSYKGCSDGIVFEDDPCERCELDIKKCLLATAKWVYGNNNPEKLLDKVTKAAEALEWEVHSTDDGLEFEYSSPAGEDFRFYVASCKTAETVLAGIKEYCDDFDPEEHALSNVNAPGAPGLRVLLDDADYIEDALEKLKDAVKGTIIKWEEEYGI